MRACRLSVDPGGAVAPAFPAVPIRAHLLPAFGSGPSSSSTLPAVPPPRRSVAAASPSSDTVDAASPMSDTVDAASPSSDTVDAASPTSDTVDTASPSSAPADAISNDEILRASGPLSEQANDQATLLSELSALNKQPSLAPAKPPTSPQSGPGTNHTLEAFQWPKLLKVFAQVCKLKILPRSMLSPSFAGIEVPIAN